MCMYTRHPNILRWLTYGFFPENTYSGVLFSSTLCGVWFCTYTPILADSSHRCMRRYWSWSIALVVSKIVIFFLSVPLFCCGLYGVVNSLLIHEFLHNSLNSSYVNSPPLSDQKVLIFFCVVLDQGFEFLELIEYFILAFQEIYPCLPRKNHQWKKHNRHTHSMN